MADRKECDECRIIGVPGTLRAWLAVKPLEEQKRGPVSPATGEVCGLACLKARTDRALEEQEGRLARERARDDVEAALGTDDFEPALARYEAVNRAWDQADPPFLDDRIARYRERDRETVALTCERTTT